jgi:hypothetical protein
MIAIAAAINAAAAFSMSSIFITVAITFPLAHYIYSGAIKSDILAYARANAISINIIYIYMEAKCD